MHFEHHFFLFGNCQTDFNRYRPIPPVFHYGIQRTNSFHFREGGRWTACLQPNHRHERYETGKGCRCLMKTLFAFKRNTAKWGEGAQGKTHKARYDLANFFIWVDKKKKKQIREETADIVGMKKSTFPWTNEGRGTEVLFSSTTYPAIVVWPWDQRQVTQVCILTPSYFIPHHHVLSAGL